jgi:hypothetical protein
MLYALMSAAAQRLFIAALRFLLHLQLLQQINLSYKLTDLAYQSRCVFSQTQSAASSWRVQKVKARISHTIHYLLSMMRSFHRL